MSYTHPRVRISLPPKTLEIFYNIRYYAIIKYIKYKYTLKVYNYINTILNYELNIELLNKNKDDVSNLTLG